MTLYSIGHSNVEIETFLGLLRRHGIKRLVDTRSQPYSRYSPQFSREALRAALNEAGINYVFMGDRIGGRPEGSEYYLPSGKVDYDLLATAPAYLSGIESLIELGVASRTAFMCSEADFHHCHRYHLITRTLVNRGVEVQHITHSGELAGSTKGEFEPAQPSLF
ncbi:MAG TPA: DUF488 domain-containing protein [Blastocatellia bacterium]|nr:DUF488 domain-containing protein [Blastocatellia bacterium]